MEGNMIDLFSKRSYKLSLFKWIRWQFQRLKYIYQRARWGFSEYDIWDLDSYLADLLRDMFAYFAKHHTTHPYYMTAEEWQQILIEISESFAQYTRDLPDPAYKAYSEATIRTKNADGSTTVETPEGLLEAWREEEKANYEYRMNAIKKGFELMLKYYSNLWD
jgi:hypothetical protein